MSATYNEVDVEYHRLLEKLLRVAKNFSRRDDRTNTGTYSLFGEQLKFHDISSVFPLLTTKRVFLRGVLEELLWFCRAETNWKTLAEKKVHIWDAWGDQETGELGPVYGHLWRKWRGLDGQPPIDQLQNMVDSIKSNPFSRRHIVSAWDAALVPEQAKKSLPACHMFFQCYVEDDSRGRRLDLHFYMRSADYFLGVPFNIASYGALLLILAAKTGSIARNLIVSFGDVHLYANHIEQAKLQYSRESSPYLPLLIYIGGDKPWEEIKAEDFLLEHYSPHPEIKAPIAV